MSSIAERGTKERYEQDREMIENPMKWPSVSMKLPIKNPGRYNSRKPAFGWLYTGMEWPGLERTVYFGTIFDRSPAKESHTYQDVWALLDDGWTVD